jgi:hypothetical protein
MESIKTGIALWQLSQLLSESENELWLSNNIHLFFLPMKFGSTFIFSTILAETAVFGIDLNTLQGGTTINIQPDYHNIPIYNLFKIPIENIMLSDSSIYNVTCKKYMNDYNIRNILSFCKTIAKNKPKNALEGRLQYMLLKKSYESVSFLQYIEKHTIYR